MIMGPSRDDLRLLAQHGLISVDNDKLVLTDGAESVIGSPNRKTRRSGSCCPNRKSRETTLATAVRFGSQAYKKLGVGEEVLHFDISISR